MIGLAGRVRAGWSRSVNFRWGVIVTLAMAAYLAWRSIGLPPPLTVPIVLEADTLRVGARVIGAGGEAARRFGVDPGLVAVRLRLRNLGNGSIQVLPQRVFAIDGANRAWPLLTAYAARTRWAAVSGGSAPRPAVGGSAPVPHLTGFALVLTLQDPEDTGGMDRGWRRWWRLVFGGDPFPLESRVLGDLRAAVPAIPPIAPGQWADGYGFFSAAGMTGGLRELRLAVAREGRVETFRLPLGTLPEK